MIRLHRYPDGLTGLAAFCDVCGERITENGYVVWNDERPDEMLIIHQGRCDPGREHGYGASMPLETELVYLANSVGADLKRAARMVRLYSMI
jgi:hypothetical protein